MEFSVLNDLIFFYYLHHSAYISVRQHSDHQCVFRALISECVSTESRETHWQNNEICTTIGKAFVSWSSEFFEAEYVISYKIPISWITPWGRTQGYWLIRLCTKRTPCFYFCNVKSFFQAFNNASRLFWGI